MSTSYATTEPDASSEDRGTRTVGVDGTPVAYREFGDPLGDPVVCFHGTPGSRQFGAVYDDAAHDVGVRVVSFDRPGYGDSPHRGEHAPTDTPELVAEVLNDVGVEQAGLVAFSGGAPHALATAAQLSDRVTSVDVVAGAVPPNCLDSLPGAQQMLGALADATPRLLGGLLRGQAWVARRRPPSFVATQYTTGDARDVPADVAAVAKRDFITGVSGDASGVVAESRQAVTDWDVAVGDVECRVRWFHGERDENVPVEGAREFGASLPDSELTTLERVDHLGCVAATRERVLAAHAPG